MFHKPDFSILMANYNNAKYIGEAIKSVLRQTYNNWELIIVDDCSKDNSEKIIKSYLSDFRIKFYKNKNNLGYIKTLKILMEKAGAEIVGILDSDDALYPQTIEEVLNVYNKFPEVGFVYTQFEYCDENLEPIKRGCSRGLNCAESEILKYRVGAFRSYKKSAYNQTTGYDENIFYAEDRDIILKLEEVTKFYYIDKILYKYRRVPNSHTLHPIKAEEGKISYIIAKYNAYRRRLNTNIPNLSKSRVSYELLFAVPSALKVKNWSRLKFLLITAIKLYPLNIKGWIMLFYRLVKFPFYRGYKLLWRRKNLLICHE